MKYLAAWLALSLFTGSLLAFLSVRPRTEQTVFLALWTFPVVVAALVVWVSR